MYETKQNKEKVSRALSQKSKIRHDFKNDEYNYFSIKKQKKNNTAIHKYAWENI